MFPSLLSILSSLPGWVLYAVYGGALVIAAGALVVLFVKR